MRQSGWVVVYHANVILRMSGNQRTRYFGRARFESHSVKSKNLESSSIWRFPKGTSVAHHQQIHISWRRRFLTAPSRFRKLAGLVAKAACLFFFFFRGHRRFRTKVNFAFFLRVYVMRSLSLPQARFPQNETSKTMMMARCGGSSKQTRHVSFTYFT